jgi:hypothetical protein
LGGHKIVRRKGTHIETARHIKAGLDTKFPIGFTEKGKGGGSGEHKKIKLPVAKKHPNITKRKRKSTTKALTSFHNDS